MPPQGSSDPGRHYAAPLLFTEIQMPSALDGNGFGPSGARALAGVLLVIASGRMKPPAEIPDDGRFVIKPYRAEELSARWMI